MDATYSQSGSYIALGSLALIVLSHFGINTTLNTVLSIIGGIGALVGIIKQAVNHKSLAIATGILPE